MSNPRVYLAGGINGLSYDEATAWRNQARSLLAEVGIDAFSPMRDKEFLAGEHSMKSVAGTYSDPMTTARAVMTRDYNDCVSADLLLVNFLGLNQISAGTTQEMAWAYHLRIPTVVVSEPDNPNVTHTMLSQCVDFRVDTMGEALRIVKSILLPGGSYE